MNLLNLLSARAEPIRCAVLGCGKFATMFLSQARRLPNLHVAAVADLSAERARVALMEAGYPAEGIGSPSLQRAVAEGTTYVTEQSGDLLGASGIDVVVEATGDPLAATEHAAAAIDGGQHVVMVSVEADVLVGPLLAQRAGRNGVVYSMAYGDQPALISELVDWARIVGLDVVAAGKGTKYLPEYHSSTPETVWDHYGFTVAYAREARLNAAMFNSFLDGTKSAIEMAAVANATGLVPPEDGLRFPPAGVDDLAAVCIPEAAGGALPHSGTVEVVSSLHRDGSEVARDLRWGVYVTVQAPSDYVARCFAEYGLSTDASGRFTTMYRPYHLIGLELTVSVVSAALRGEPTGTPAYLTADVVATAKRDLTAGDELDGEGGFTVFGMLTTAAASRASQLLPIGLARGARVLRPAPRGTPLSWADVEVPGDSLARRLRTELLQRSE
ncbi:MAG: flagellar biosynthesis protein FlgA [Streptosporangiales bacterium]|nr:flagellar biosynthesis protein FlgA [Streptosporangiales bacterium]